VICLIENMNVDRAINNARWVVVPLFCACLLAGCASTPKADWNSRIGTYTYDQAVVELGPPDKTAELSDGSTMADWIKRRSSGTGVSIGFGTGFYRGSRGSGAGVGTGVGVGQTIGGGDSYLRLIFGKDGFLQRWEKGP
jgi:hypothetical protein